MPRVYQNSRIKTEAGRGLREDWSQLSGRTVEVWRGCEYVGMGVVELASADDAVLWLAADGPQGRRLYDKRSGYQVWA